MQECVAIPEELQGDELILFTDSNQGPQDTSKAMENESQTVTKQELKSIQGFYLTYRGTHIMGGKQRKTR